MRRIVLLAIATWCAAMHAEAQVPSNTVAVTGGPQGNPTFLQLPKPVNPGNSVVVACNFSSKLSLTFSDNQNSSYTSLVPSTSWNSPNGMGEVMAAEIPAGGVVTVSVGYTGSSGHLNCYAVETAGPPLLDGSMAVASGVSQTASVNLSHVSAGDNVLGFVFCQSCAGGTADSYLTVVNAASDVVLAMVKKSNSGLSVDFNLKYSQAWLAMALPFKAPVWPVAAAPTINLGSIIVACTTNGSVTHTVALAWKPSPGSATYNIYRGTLAGGPYVEIGTASTPSYSDPNVLTGNIYHYVVTAVNAAGESIYSNEAVASIP